MPKPTLNDHLHALASEYDQQATGAYIDVAQCQINPHRLRQPAEDLHRQSARFATFCMRVVKKIPQNLTADAPLDEAQQNAVRDFVTTALASLKEDFLAEGASMPFFRATVEIISNRVATLITSKA